MRSLVIAVVACVVLFGFLQSCQVAAERIAAAQADGYEVEQ